MYYASIFKNKKNNRIYKILVDNFKKKLREGSKEKKIYKAQTQPGFTLVEVMVVIAIISLLLTIFLANYRTGEKEYSLLRTANRLAQDIRKTGIMAISTKECQECAEIIPPDYGIFFDLNDTKKYLIYADTDENEFYTSGDTMIESIELEKGIIITTINTPSKKVSINFIPPDPTIKIKDKEGGDEINEVKITIALESDQTKTKTITVNKFGLIDIE